MTLRIAPTSLVEQAEASGNPGLLAIAEGWGRVPLGKVARVINGAPYESRFFNVEGRGEPLIRIRDVTSGRVSTWYEGPWEPLHRVEPGAILIGMDGDFRVARWAAEPGLLNQRVCRVEVDESRYDGRFLFLAIQGYLDAIWKATSSITVKHLSSRSIQQIPLPDPPLDEQRRIVEILEDHLSRLDAARQTLARQISRLDVLRLSRLQLVRAAVIAQGAPLSSVGEVAETSLGKMLDAKKSAGTPTPYLRNINVRWGHIDTSDVLEVPLRDDERSRFALRSGDLLVCEGGEPGRCAVWSGSESVMAYQKALHRVRTDPKLLDTRFLATMIEYVIRSGQADHLFTGTTIRHLPQEKLRSIRVPVPALGTQRRFVADHRQFDDAVSRLHGEISTATRRAEVLRRSLLAAAFSGKLTGSASDLDRVEELASEVCA